MIKYYLIIFYFFQYSTFLYAQVPCECATAVKLRPEIVNFFNNGKSDSVLYLFNQVKKDPSPECQLFFFHSIAQLGMQQNQYYKTAYALQEADSCIKKTSCGQYIYAKHYAIYGTYYLNTNKLDSAINAYLKAIAAAEATGDYYSGSRSMHDAAVVFSLLDQTEKAYLYYKKSIATGAKVDDSVLLSGNYCGLAGIYSNLYEKSGNLNFIDSAYNTAMLGLGIATKYGNGEAVQSAYNTISYCMLVKKKYKAALQYADSAIMNAIPGLSSSEYGQFVSYKRKTTIYRAILNQEMAAMCADSALIYGKHFNAETTIDGLQLVYDQNKLMNNSSKALEAFEQLTLLQDSIHSVKLKTAVTEIEKKYNQEKNERIINELSLQKKIYLLLAAAGLLAIIIIGSALRQQSLNHKQKIMETEQRLSRARMNPHFFFNALTTLQRFALRENDGKALASNLSKFSHLMRETLENSYKEYVSIKQEMGFLKEYIEIQKIRYPETFTSSIMIDGEMEPEDLLIPSMILQPFVENSIEHGFAGISYPGIISIHFYKKEKEILIIIKDNGKGLSEFPKENHEHVSRASQIIKDRIYLLNIKLKTKAGFTISNDAEGGVMVTIHLPIIYNYENTGS
ncbi:MAG: histidine kinase [Chitinophagaceae bacterium]|nr:histidine kinase [Chitinophagaceae bacterium]